MGVVIIPPDKNPPVWECPTCFDPGETPATIWAFLADIEQGPGWNPGLAPPPNGIFELTADGACRWIGGDGIFSVLYTTGPGGTGLLITYHLLFWSFGKDTVVPCEAWFDLLPHGPPPDIYTGGYAVIGIAGDCPLISLEELALSVGLHPGPNLSAHGWPKAGQEAVIQYIDPPEDSGIKILYDCS